MSLEKIKYTVSANSLFQLFKRTVEQRKKDDRTQHVIYAKLILNNFVK